jgi:O-acetyl-ADP-ribose deacetylase
MVQPLIVEGDLLDQDVEVIVNAWNRNIIPWWLLLPQGVSGAIKRRGGYRPFFEVGKAGPIPLGGAVQTSAGRLPHKAIIHVAGISMLWRASAKSIQGSVASAMALVNQNGFTSVAFPTIGAGTGSFDERECLRLMLETFEPIETSAKVVVVLFRPRKWMRPSQLEKDGR